MRHNAVFHLLASMKGKKKSKEQIPPLDEQQKTLKKIGNKIRTLRKEKGYSSHETFAYENEIDRTQMGRYERGSDMQLTSLLKVLNALDTSLEEFFQGFKD